MSVINKSRWLHHVNLLFKQPMEKSILHIKLSKRPTTRDCKRQEKPNSSRLNNWVECILIVQTMMLLKPLSHKTHFVALNGTICMFLHLESPF